MRNARIAALLTLALAAVWSAYSYEQHHVESMRRGGQAAVDALHAKLQDSPALDPLLDRVCAQKDCRASRLFWYTDLEEAKEAARALRRPILSLHLLGRLDEELSCANSRFFRVMLYSDPEIASILRDRYVLHWKSVRPVPHLTIDMGDGRRIRQTITGNSIHYLLDAEGVPLDALPGLHAPAAFRAQLESWLELRRESVREYHEARTAAPRVWMYARPAGRPVATDAAVLATTKAVTEVRVLNQLEIGGRRLAPEPPPVSAEEAEDVVFSAESLALMRTKQPLDDVTLGNLRQTVAFDTMFNESELHRRIHEWFARGEVRDLESLNERVYAELFLTPSDDPWLGLNPAGVFTAIGE